VGDPLTFIRAVHFAATLALAGTLVFGAAVAGPALRERKMNPRPFGRGCCSSLGSASLLH
jgi:hypothetical protein